MPYRFTVAVVVILFLAGCSGSSNFASRRANLSPAAVQQSVRDNQQHLRSMHGEGRISIESPSVAQTGSFVLSLRKPDSVLVVVEGPFGIRVGTALVTRDEFTFYNSMENQVITGRTSPQALRRVLQLSIDFDDVLNLFTGGTFAEEDQRPPDSIQHEDEAVVLEYRTDAGTRQYWIDPASQVLRKIVHLDRNGRLVLEQSFANFQEVDGVKVPFNIRVIQPRERNRVALAYSDISINSSSIRFTFSIPPNAERIRLR